MLVNLHAEDLSGPAAGTPLQPATGGGPGLVSGSYGSANAPANSGVSFALPSGLATFSTSCRKDHFQSNTGTLVTCGCGRSSLNFALHSRLVSWGVALVP